ncbi:MAG: TetR/AcrR family transcriptional regulator [Gemmatimonadetes bacterium]|nr:TetR/AcrR family transcriptional regulator [Gemmatimonadota bacterium]
MSATDRTRAPRKTKGERRDDIAFAALRVLGRGGRKALTIANLAEEVGFTNGALYRHYASIEHIVAEAALITIEAVEDTFPPSTYPALPRLMLLARERVNTLAGNAGHAWMLRSEQAPELLPEMTVTQLRGLVRRSRDYVLRAIREGSEAGTIRSDIAPEQLTVIVMGTIHALTGAGPQSGSAHADATKTLDALETVLTSGREQ